MVSSEVALESTQEAAEIYPEMRELLELVVEKKASDLLITVGVPPVIRVNGELVSTDFKTSTPSDVKCLIHSILNEEQKEYLQENRELDLSIDIEGIARFRVNAYWQRDSLAAAIRYVPVRIPTLRELDLPPIIADLARKDQGLILVTGPTGSGKSTTLAAMVDIVNNERACHIVTIEDPVECLHTHKKSIVDQREVGNDTKSFANALRHVLRQDPDVILIGEMRDLESISAGLTAAETGHLVLSTLHTNSASQTVDRMIDVFPPHQQPQVRLQLSVALQAVLAQELLPRADINGMIPAVEVMICNAAVQNLIREKQTAQLYSVIETGAKQGMQTMDQALIKLYQTGKISYESALRKVRNIEDFRKRILP